jgi:hypothetical protein
VLYVSFRTQSAELNNAKLLCNLETLVSTQISCLEVLVPWFTCLKCPNKILTAIPKENSFSLLNLNKKQPVCKNSN